MVVASGTLALIVAAIFVVLVVAIREQRRSARAAIKSEQAITAGVSLEKLAIDLETGVRGFVASGSPALLKPYTNSTQQYPQQA
jgi:CHASE3 domain sensor protein